MAALLRKDAFESDSMRFFYHSIKPVVIAAEFFGLLPVDRPFRSDPKEVRFAWISFKTVYTYAVLMFLTTVCLMSLKSVFSSLGSTANAKDITAIMSGFIFHFSAMFSIGFFFNVARHLPPLMESWDTTSNRMVKYIPFGHWTHNGNSNNRVNPLKADRISSTVTVAGRPTIAGGDKPHSGGSQLYISQRTMVLFATFFMFSALLDRVLHDARFTLDDICANSNVTTYTECYLTHNAQFLVEQVGYQDWAAAVILLVNFFTTVTWNFLDLFIVLLSLGLHRNFLHLNRYLEATKNFFRRPEDWKIIREDHLALSKLVSLVDEALSVGILYCYTANLISICTQMFLGLRPRNSAAIETSYTTVSFIHLVCRTGLVTWAASRVHDAYQVPLRYIHSCSSASYGLETQRLRAHILETPACLSGCRFFFITRSFFLGIVSVVITYEVIFLELK